MRKIISILLLLPLFLQAQIKVKNLPTTSTGTLHDYLIKDDSAGTSGATKKISIVDFITAYSLSTGGVPSLEDVLTIGGNSTGNTSIISPSGNSEVAIRDLNLNLIFDGGYSSSGRILDSTHLYDFYTVSSGTYGNRTIDSTKFRLEYKKANGNFDYVHMDESSIVVHVEDSVGSNAAELTIAKGSANISTPTGQYVLNSSINYLSHDTKIGFDAPTIQLPQFSGGSFLWLNSSSYITPVVIDSSKLGFLRNVTSDVQYQIDSIGEVSGLTPSYIPVATSPKSLGDSWLYQNGNNIGLGTTSPAARLHVKSDGSSTSGLSVFELDNAGDSLLFGVKSNGHIDLGFGDNSYWNISMGLGAGIGFQDNLNFGINAGSHLDNNLAVRALNIGMDAGYWDSIGNQDINIGVKSGNDNKIGNDNVNVGTSAGEKFLSSNNTLVGTFAGGLGVNTGGDIVGVGRAAFANATSAALSAGVGTNAFFSTTTGSGCAGIGYGVGFSNLTGVGNFYGGREAGYGSTNADFNVITGAFAGHEPNSGYNVFSGPYSGYNNVGASSLMLGPYSGFYETGSNKLILDNTLRASESDGRLKAIVYGEFNASPSLQLFRINANLQLLQLTPSNVPFLNWENKFVSSSIDSTEFSCVDGATSNFQDQIDALTGGGTVTNVATGYGLTGGPITTTGTIVADTSAGKLATQNYVTTHAGTGTVTSIATSNGITGGTITGTGTISGVNAAADGSTKGVSSYTATDFDAASGNISLDYTNGQKATTSIPGFLSSTDWTTFNNKQATVSVTKPISITANVISIPAASATDSGFVTTRAQTFAGVKTFSSTISGSINGNAATVTTNANLTGDVTSVGNATTLATVNSNVGSFTNGSFTVNGKGLITAASSGSAPEVPLTFSTGLTRSTNTITANLATGVSGGQTAIGGTGVTDALTFKSTTGNATTTATAFSFTGGNNGATTIASMLNNGTTSFGPASTTGLVNITSAGGVGTIPFYIQNTNSVWQSTLYLENNRGSLASYAGFSYGGSANVSSNLFGLSRADKLFLFADGASNLGMGIGTLGAQPVTIGTNNTPAIAIDGSQLININNGATTNARQVRITQGTGVVNLGNVSNSTSFGMVGFGTAAMSLANAALYGDGNSVFLNSNTSVNTRISGTSKLSIDANTITWTPGASTSGAVAAWTYTAPANTGQTAATEANSMLWDLSAIMTHASNTTIATQRDFYIKGRTHAFASAGGGIITDGFTLYADPPLVGTNTSATSRLWAAGFNGRVGIATNLYVGGLTTGATALIHYAAGTATASTAPEKYTAGTLLSSIEALTTEANASSVYQSNVALNRYAMGGVIKTFVADVNNSGTGETDLFTYTTKASTLGATGEEIHFHVAGTFNDATASGQLQFYFAGTSIGNTGVLTMGATGAWVADIYVMRTGASTARADVNISTPTGSTAVYTSETDLTGLTFTNTNIIKVTGTAGGVGGGSNDITAKKGSINWYGADNN